MQKTPYVSPLVGGREIEHLKGNIEGLSLKTPTIGYADFSSSKSIFGF